MAKGNMLLGYSRGSVGDVTFYRAGGSQRQRARNRQPNNPRTAKQMTQRSKFANAVKFFKQINTGFFKYAFEDRKTNESDYNAFMRHNVVNSGYIGAQASKIADWPALGLWQLSAGSLPEITAPFPQPSGGAAAAMYFDLGVTMSEYDTVGELSAALINGAPAVWRTGDIFTFVVYRATNAATLPTVDTSETHQVYADYGQFILNADDATPLTDIKANIGACNVTPSTGTEGFYLAGDDSAMLDVWTDDLVGYSVIHSRNSANGLLVSNSTMVYNKRELPLLAMDDSGAYYNSVIADWQASADAILQGAAASTASALPFGRVGSFFLGGDTEIMDVNYGVAPVRANVTFTTTPAAATKIIVRFTDITNLAAIDPQKVSIEGVGAYTYNASESEIRQEQVMLFFDLSAALASKPSGVVIYYDGQVIETIAFA